MHHDPLSQKREPSERAINLSILTVSQNLVKCPVCGVVLTWTSSKTGTTLTAVVLIFGRKRWNRRKRATTNDNDAIDADMHARAGDAELTPWLSWSQIVHHTFHVASDTEAEMISSRLMTALFGAAATAGAANSSTPTGASSPSSLLWSSASGFWLAVAGLGFCIWRVRLLCCTSWKQFSRVQTLYFCEKPTLLHLIR